LKVKEKREHRETYGGSRASSPAGRGGGFLGGAEVFTFSSLYLTEWKKWIVYTKYKLNCHKVYIRKSSIIEIRVIGHPTHPPCDLGVELFSDRPWVACGTSKTPPT